MISSELKALRCVDQATLELRERNAQRVAAMKEEMGRKYLLHPDNAMTKNKFKKIERINA